MSYGYNEPKSRPPINHIPDLRLHRIKGHLITLDRDWTKIVDVKEMDCKTFTERRLK